MRIKDGRTGVSARVVTESEIEHFSSFTSPKLKKHSIYSFPEGNKQKI